MAGRSYPGMVVGDVIEARFPFSGTVAKVVKQFGDSVSVNELLANLSPNFLQTELDRELADYERIRAQFEIFVAKQGQPQSDIAKFEKIQIQSQLTVSVKAVEIAKYRLDQTRLLSPVTGLILAAGGLRPGLHVTPSSNSFQILDISSLVFAVDVGWSDLADFPAESPVWIQLKDRSESLSGSIQPFIPPLPGKNPRLVIQLKTSDPLVFGCPGVLSFSGEV